MKESTSAVLTSITSGVIAAIVGFIVTYYTMSKEITKLKIEQTTNEYQYDRHRMQSIMDTCLNDYLQIYYKLKFSNIKTNEIPFVLENLKYHTDQLIISSDDNKLIDSAKSITDNLNEILENYYKNKLNFFSNDSLIKSKIANWVIMSKDYMWYNLPKTKPNLTKFQIDSIKKSRDLLMLNITK
jgi:hypothetical protein